MSELHRLASKRAMRNLARRVGGPRTVAANTGSGSTTSKAAADRMAADTTVSTLPKFIMGHPTLGAIPADPETNPTWEI